MTSGLRQQMMHLSCWRSRRHALSQMRWKLLVLQISLNLKKGQILGSISAHIFVSISSVDSKKVTEHTFVFCLRLSRAVKRHGSRRCRTMDCSSLKIRPCNHIWDFLEHLASASLCKRKEQLRLFTFKRQQQACCH